MKQFLCRLQPFTRHQFVVAKTFFVCQHTAIIFLIAAMSIFVWLLAPSAFLSFAASIELNESDFLSRGQKISWGLIAWLIPYAGFLLARRAMRKAGRTRQNLGKDSSGFWDSPDIDFPDSSSTSETHGGSGDFWGDGHH